MSARVWKVVVDCWCKPEPIAGEPFRETRHFLVEAVNATDAFERAAKYAEDTAKFGAKWVSFDVRSAAPASIPMEIPL